MSITPLEPSVALACAPAKVEKRKLFFTMVDHPVKGWVRVGNRYLDRDTARSWVPFVRNSWGGQRVKVEPCEITLIDGQISPESCELLSTKFNMDCP